VFIIDLATERIFKITDSSAVYGSAYVALTETGEYLLISHSGRNRIQFLDIYKFVGNGYTAIASDFEVPLKEMAMGLMREPLQTGSFLLFEYVKPWLQACRQYFYFNLDDLKYGPLRGIAGIGVFAVPYQNDWPRVLYFEKGSNIFVRQIVDRN
jgi:hypothetical protein